MIILYVCIRLRVFCVTMALPKNRGEIRQQKTRRENAMASPTPHKDGINRVCPHAFRRHYNERDNMFKTTNELTAINKNVLFFFFYLLSKVKFAR